jgi:hypothetical protein
VPLYPPSYFSPASRAQCQPSCVSGQRKRAEIWRENAEIAAYGFNSASNGVKIFEMKKAWVASKAAVQKKVDGVRDELWKTWSDILYETSVTCRIDLLASADKRATFRRSWVRLLECVQELIVPLYLDLTRIAQAHRALLHAYPDRWAESTTYELLQEEVVFKDGTYIPDAWIEAAFPPEAGSNWHTWANIYESADPDPEVVLESLRQSFNETIRKGFLELCQREFTLSSVHKNFLSRTGMEPGRREVESSTVFHWGESAESARRAAAIPTESMKNQTTVDEELSWTLEDLYDHLRRQQAISRLHPGLVKQIIGGWSAHRQCKPRDVIKKQFPLLGELEDAELDKVVTNQRVTAYSAATDVIRKRCPDLESGTIEKYAQPSYRKRKGWAA